MTYDKINRINSSSTPNPIPNYPTPGMDYARTKIISNGLNANCHLRKPPLSLARCTKNSEQQEAQTNALAVRRGFPATYYLNHSRGKNIFQKQKRPSQSRMPVTVTRGHAHTHKAGLRSTLIYQKHTQGGQC